MPTEYRALIRGLKDSLRLSRLPSLQLDICVSACPEDDVLLLPTPALYTSMGVRPTHTLFYCNLFRNCNYATVELEAARLRFRRTFYQKLNCYSAIEDTIAGERSRTFIPMYSAAMLMERLYGHMLGAHAASSKAQRDRFSELCYLPEGARERAHSFRLEARVNLFQVDSAVQFFASRVTAENFVAMDFDAFGNVFSVSAALFRDAVTRCAKQDASWTFDDVLQSCTAEIVYVERFIKGGQNVHMLSTPARHAAADPGRYSSAGFAVPRAVLTKPIDAMQTKQCATKQVLRELLAMTASKEPVKQFIELYYAQASGGAMRSCQELTARRAEFTVGTKPVAFTDWLRKLLTRPTKTARSRPVHAAYALLVVMHGGSRDYVSAALLKQMQELGADLVFAPNKRAPVTKLIRLELAAAGHHRGWHVELLSELKGLRGTSGYAWSEAIYKGWTKCEELARIAHGLVLFANHPNCYDRLHDCLSYGFFFIRSHTWMKNRRYVFETVVKNIAELREVLALARSYSPLNTSVEHLIERMHEHDITPDEDAIAKIRELYEIEQRDLLPAQLGRAKVNTLSDYEILAGFMNAKQIARLLKHFKIAREDLDVPPPAPPADVAIEPISSHGYDDGPRTTDVQLDSAPTPIPDDISSHGYDDGPCETDAQPDPAPTPIPSVDSQPSAANFYSSPPDTQIAATAALEVLCSGKGDDSALNVTQDSDNNTKSMPPESAKPVLMREVISQMLLSRLRRKYTNKSLSASMVSHDLYAKKNRPPFDDIEKALQMLLKISECLIVDIVPLRYLSYSSITV
ncbi:hypothetical protein PAPHI01_2632 [Pancytospora philotis]|nr:hypothetical protein PAPHI01_2632 [Pancytospora philotis]